MKREILQIIMKHQMSLLNLFLKIRIVIEQVLNIPSYVLLVDDRSAYLNYFLLDPGCCWRTTADEDSCSHSCRRGGNLKRPGNKKLSKGLKFHQKMFHRGGRHVLILYQTSLLYGHEPRTALNILSHSIFSLFVNTFAWLTG